MSESYVEKSQISLPFHPLNTFWFLPGAAAFSADVPILHDLPWLNIRIYVEYLDNGGDWVCANYYQTFILKPSALFPSMKYHDYCYSN